MGRYKLYKKSGFEWIGDIPDSWEIVRLKNIVSSEPNSMVDGPFGSDLKNEEYVVDGVPIIQLNNIGIGVHNESNLKFVTEDKAAQLSRHTVWADEIVMAKMADPVARATIVSASYPFYIVSADCIRVKLSDTYSKKFLVYSLNTFIRREAELLSTGTTRVRINLQTARNLHAVSPSLSTQEAIVSCLDRRTAEIDTLLADLQSQVEMLDTYKRELIAEAVTKGLGASVAMKDSGVDWIGDTPVHWKATKIKWMFEIVKRIYGKEDRDVLSITQRGIKVKDTESNEGQLADSYANYQVVNVNDFAMNSMDLLTGWVDCSQFEGVTSPDYRVFRFLPGKEQCHNYYKYLFQMCYKNRIFYRLGQGVSNLGRWRLQADQFLNMRLPQPPVEEQEEIAAYLDSKTNQIEGLIADITAQIEMLKQHRQIVIHDAVTGKIKVTEG